LLVGVQFGGALTVLQLERWAREPAGVATAGTINALGYILWSIRLIGTGIALLRFRFEVDPLGTPAAVAPI